MASSKYEKSNNQTGAHREQEVIMVIVDIKDQERFDQALAILRCGYCKKIYSTKAQMSYPTEVYSRAGRVKIWRPKCKECVKSSSFNIDTDDFSPVVDSIAGKIITPEGRDEIWAALENAAINMTSFGETFVPLVNVLKVRLREIRRFSASIRYMRRVCLKMWNETINSSGP